MVDKRSVEAKFHELQNMSHEIIIEGMSLDEQFHIDVIIDKLAIGRKEFKNLLR